MTVALLAVAALCAAASPLATEQRDVREGNARLGAGDAAAALARYDVAERAIGGRPEIDYDRGLALLRLGRSTEAIASLRRAAARGDAALASRALQGVGTALEGSGDRDGALRALGEALARDPANDDARYDLELLLRRRAGARRSAGGREERPRPEATAGQRDDERGRSGGSADARGDRTVRPPDAEAARAREGAREGAPPDAPPRGEGAGPGNAAAAPRGEPLPPEEAARLLDALRARERTLPPGAWGARADGRGDAEQDW